MRVLPSALAMVLGVAVCAALLAGPVRAEPPFTGTASVGFGDKVNAAFAGFDGEVHQFNLVATRNSRLDATVVPAPGSAARPVLRIVRPGGWAVSGSRSRAAADAIRGFRFPYSGTFVLEVSSNGRSGAYSLSIGGRVARRERGILPAATGDDTWSFFSVAGAVLSVTATPRGAASRRTQVQITGLTDPAGGDIPITATQNGATSSIRGVTLREAGEYHLAYSVTGRPADVSFAFSFVNPSGGAVKDLGAPAGLPPGVVDAGHPEIAARAGYVGSRACGRCHDAIFASWSQTAHNAAARTWNRTGLSGRTFANDVDGNAIDDFRDGLDLATQPAFTAYGASAPKLSYVPAAALPYKITIGAVTYDVERVMGGNGLWKQRYLVRVGRQLYPSPVQFNETTRAYAAYDPGDWYDAAKAPRYAVASAITSEKSFEARCSGCHNTGETIEVDPGTGEFLTGYVEFNIGCEQCHGPGADHAAWPVSSKIRNPRNLVDGSPAGAAAANAVCGRCHTRGEAVDVFAGTATRAGFPYSQSGGVAQAFDEQSAFFTPTTKASDFFGRRANPFPALPGDTWVASKSHRQQSFDVASGAHAPGSGSGPVCFECHDPHARANEHQVARIVDRGGAVATRAEDNTLCLACHARGGDFLAVTRLDVAAIPAGPAPVAVVRAVVDHMKDKAGMPVADTKYDPTGTGVGRCIVCHMPRMSKSAAYTPDKAGHQAGDQGSHRFQTVWPNASVLHGTTNSCTVCHPLAADDATKTIIDQWAGKGADGDSTFHADTPLASQAGIANAGSSGGGVRCAGCHTSEGFVRIQVRGETPSQSEIDAILKDAIARDKGITCQACHGSDASGLFAAGANPLRFPKKELCGKCHNGQTVAFADFQARGELIRHPQDEMLKGTAGSEPPGSGAYPNSAHSALGDGCVACHFDKTNRVESHEFQPKLATCSTSSCHPGLTSFDRTARADYDGDGLLEGLQTEVDGLLDALRGALLLDVRVAYDAATGYFDIHGAKDHRMSGASDAQKRAVHNFYSVKFDASRGIHNSGRAVRLLQQSYKGLTGADVPGAVMR